MAEDQKQSAELRIKLIVDDQTQETVDRLKGSLGGVEEHTHNITTNSHEIAKGVFEGNAYWEATKKIVEGIEEGIKAVYEVAEKITEEAIHSADAANEQERGMTGLLHLMDSQEHSMKAIAQYTGEVREELEKAGLQAGVSTAQMTDMFSTIVERGHLSSEQAKELTIQMSEVGKITRGGMGGLAEGFAMMEIGIVRARNPLVQLIATMDILHGNARSVAQQMQKMTPEKQMDLARKALEKQAEQLRSGGGVPLTLGELKTSFAGYREMFFESMGKPILEVLIPALTRVQHWLGENAETIKEYGAKIGDYVERVVVGTEKAVSGIYDAISSRMGELSAWFDETKATWEGMWAYATGESKGIRADFKSMTDHLIDAFKAGERWARATVETFANIGEQLGAAKDLIVESARGVSELLGGQIDDAMAAFEKAGAAATTPYGGASARMQAGAAGDVAAKAADVYTPESARALDDAIAKYHELALAAGQSAGDVDKQVEALRDHHNAMMQLNEQFSGAVGSMNTDVMSNYINSAVKSQNDAALVFAAQSLASSETAALALKDGAIKIDEGFDKFIETVAERSPEAAAALKKAMTGEAIKDIRGRGGANINFNGATFQIHQDFRDQDPDRVMVAFRRDLVRHAVARIGAKTDTGFGGV